MFRRLLRQNPPENIHEKSGAERKSLRDAGNLAFLQISSGLVEHKELPSILNVIVQKSLNCLKAHRSTIFLMEGKSGILKTQSTHVSDPRDVQVGMFEEKEVARKVIKQEKPFLLREPKDFSEFFKYEERERKLTSLMGVPLLSQRKTIGALSMVMINGDRHFNEEDLKLLSIFGNHASIAIEMAYLSDELEKAISSHKAYEGYLENIMGQLQRLSEEERQRIGEHIEKLNPDSISDENVPSEPQHDQ
ncbi:MAG: GAF domain-containing protein [Deltaproteobacteria bacterium]|nr:GAF domain-containing protein [Deltaproteobacteria bacterium]